MGVVRDESWDDEIDRWSLEGWHGGTGVPGEPKVTYVVLVDGEVLESWSEPLRESAWQQHPRTGVDYEQLRTWRKRSWTMPEGPNHHEQTIAWLERATGGVTALADLDVTPLSPEDVPMPLLLVSDHGLESGLTEAARLVDDVHERFWGGEAELRTAFRRGLAACAPGLLTGPRPWEPAVVAGAVVWAVGKANGVFRQGLKPTQKDVAAALGLKTLPAGRGGEVVRALGGPERGWSHYGWDWHQYEALGRVDLLVSATRRDMITARDNALVGQGRLAEKELARAQARAMGRAQAELMATYLYDRRPRSDAATVEHLSEVRRSREW